MTEPAGSQGGAGRRVVINLIGAVGLVFGFLPMVKYLLDLELFAFTVAPYEWLELEGAARLLPPAMVLATCLVVAYVLERSAVES